MDQDVCIVAGDIGSNPIQVKWWYIKTDRNLDMIVANWLFKSSVTFMQLSPSRYGTWLPIRNRAGSRPASCSMDVKKDIKISQVVKLVATECKSLGIVLKTYEWLDIQVQILSWLLECWLGLCMPQQPLQRWIHTQQESYNGSMGHFQCSDEGSIPFSCTNELQNSYKGITLAYHVSDEGSSPSFCSNKLGD